MRPQPGRARPRPAILATLVILALALLWPPARPAEATRLLQDPLPCAEIVRHPFTGSPHTLRRCDTPALDDASPQAIALAFLHDHHRLFYMPAELDDLRLVDVKRGLDSSHVLLQQTYAGLPVYGAYTSLHLDRGDQIQVLHNRYQSRLSVELEQATVSAGRAVEIAAAAIGLVRPRGDSASQPAQVIFPLDNDGGRLAWQVMLLAAEPQGDWEVLVDAVTGAVIKRYNRLVLDRGQVFDPNPGQQSGRTARSNLVWPELKTAILLGLDESGWLRGRYVDVTAPAGYRPATAYEPNGNFSYDPDDPRFEEVMVYHHIDATQRYIQSLGYSNDNDPPNGIRDRATRASAHWFDQDQSFYSVSDDALHFGDGGMEDAEDADIIVHEYAHALQHDQLSCWGGGEMAALGEGFGDYLAASRFANVGDDPACIAEWDSLSYAPGPSYCLRRVDRDRHYPEDVTGAPHIDGEIWSRALWDIRQAVGARIADTLALESHFYLPCDATLADAAQALLDADANVYEGAHLAALGEALVARGLLTLPPPTLLSPNGGETVTPRSRIAVSWAANHSFPATYEVQYSLDAGWAADRQDNFSGSRLPGDYLTYGNSPWQAENGSVRAGAIGHLQSSSLSLAVDVARTGEISFQYRVSSEEGWDLFEFFLDGRQVLHVSGEVDWTRYVRTLEAGSHTFLWRYRKDNTISAGQDSAWIDNLAIRDSSRATWRSIAVVPGAESGGELAWRAPLASSSAAKLRVRAWFNGVAGPWDVSDRVFAIGEPAAVRLSSFDAGFQKTSTTTAILPWGVALAGVVGLGLLLRRRRAIPKPQ